MANITKNEFYTFRDKAYQIIDKTGVRLDSIPGNPFSKFSHKSVNDSPIKNYIGELNALRAMLQQYFPQLTTQFDAIEYEKGKTIVGKILRDVAVMGAAPVQIASDSITGKKTQIGYETGAAKTVGGLVDTGNKALNIAAKSFADTVTGGLATKAANVLRSDENKETAYSYGEMQTIKNSDVGIIDKIADPLAKVSAGVGAVAGVASLASGANSLFKKESKSEDSLYASGEVPGDNDENVLDQLFKAKSRNEKQNDLLRDLQEGNEDTGIPSNQDVNSGLSSVIQHDTKTASMFPVPDNIFIIVIAAIILLMLIAKK